MNAEMKRRLATSERTLQAADANSKLTERGGSIKEPTSALRQGSATWRSFSMPAAARSLGSRCHSGPLALAALRTAVANRNPPEGCIHNTDRGCQYASQTNRDALNASGLRGSMSRVGNPYHNTQAESFMKTLKVEEVYRAGYETFADVAAGLPMFFEQVYNSKRLHSALGYRTPEEFETLFARKAA